MRGRQQGPFIFNVVRDDHKEVTVDMPIKSGVIDINSRSAA
jgi:hypothetical protein